MAYESEWRTLQGEPCEPTISGYPFIIIMNILLSILITCFFAIIIEGPVSPLTTWEIVLISVLSFPSAIYFCIVEYKERVIVFKSYNHKLDVYTRRRNMMIDNGIEIRTDKQLYNEMFS